MFPVICGVGAPQALPAVSEDDDSPKVPIITGVGGDGASAAALAMSSASMAKKGFESTAVSVLISSSAMVEGWSEFV